MTHLLAHTGLLLAACGPALAAPPPVVINEFRRDGTLTTTEYVEFLLTQDLTAAQLQSYFFGDSTGSTAAKFSAYRLQNLSTIAPVFKAGTIIVVGGSTAIGAQETVYNPTPGGSNDDWNLRLQAGGTFAVNSNSSGFDFAASDVAWIDTSSSGTTSVDSVAWVSSGTTPGAFYNAAQVRITNPNNGANVEFLGDGAALDTGITRSATSYSINSPGSLGLPNGGANTTYINSLRSAPVTNALTVSVNPASFAETDGPNAATATVTRSGSTTGALTVTLSQSGDANGITIPASVVIPDGQTSATFPVGAVNDTASNANKTVTITAAATGFTNATTQVTVTNVVVGITARIREIQGTAHLSPLNGQAVSNVEGIVTVERTNGFYIQDDQPDNNDATSEGLFVFTGSGSPILGQVAVGDRVRVSGTVEEFRPGSTGGTSRVDSDGDPVYGLTITEIVGPSVQVLSSGNPLPAPVVIGQGGRVPPSQVIAADASDVETPGDVFSPTTDGLDFYESLEGMRVQVNNALVVRGPISFGEITIVPDQGANATGLSPRGTITIGSGDFNPERIIIDDLIVASEPQVNPGDLFNAPVVGVIDYSFNNFKLLNPAPLPTFTPANLQQEVTNLQGTASQITVAAFNILNFSANDCPLSGSTVSGRCLALANLIVTNLKSPDLLSLSEVQDNNGTTDDGTVDASTTLSRLAAAIQQVGGPAYSFSQINPQNNQDGGAPGGNIRVAFLYNPARVNLVSRPGGTTTAATTVNNVGGLPQLSFSPGRIDPLNPAFTDSRKPLVAEFTFNGQTLFVIGNHFNSKGGDLPLFGYTQPPTLVSETQRLQQAQVVRGFVEQILAVNANANVIVLGDLNDFEFSPPLTTLKGSILTNVIELLPRTDRYTFNFDGNGQVLDHVLLSNNLVNTGIPQVDIVHVNELLGRASDHEPVLTSLRVGVVAPVVTALSPTSGPVGTTVTLTGTGLTGTTSVRFAGGASAPFTVVNDTTVTVTVPAGARSGRLQVSTPGGRTNTPTFTVTP